MNRINKYFICFLAITQGFIAHNLAAQQVRTEGSYIVIDCSTMPANSRRAATYTAGKAPAHNEDDAWNRVAYQKFAVSKADVAGTKDWSVAENACNTYNPNGDAGKWRLPTLHEFYLIMALQTRLSTQSGWTDFGANTYFWTATHFSSDPSGQAMTVSPGYNVGSAELTPSASNRYVRCVREF